MIDAAWLAETTMSGNSRSRNDRLDQFAFGQRVFAAADATTSPDVLVALKAFPRFRMLMLTLERIGISQPAVYAALTRHAQRLSALDAARGHAALAQFQGAIALVARLARVRTIDVPTAETLLATLAAVPLNHDGRYAGGVAQWVNVRLRSVASLGIDMEGGLAEALAGAAGPAGPGVISWEGQQYPSTSPDPRRNGFAGSASARAAQRSMSPWTSPRWHRPGLPMKARRAPRNRCSSALMPRSARRCSR